MGLKGALSGVFWDCRSTRCSCKPSNASFTFFDILFKTAIGSISRRASDAWAVEPEMEMGNLAPVAQGRTQISDPRHRFTPAKRYCQDLEIDHELNSVGVAVEVGCGPGREQVKCLYVRHSLSRRKSEIMAVSKILYCQAALSSETNFRARRISSFCMNQYQTLPLRRFSALTREIPRSIAITSSLTQPL